MQGRKHSPEEIEQVRYLAEDDHTVAEIVEITGKTTSQIKHILHSYKIRMTETAKQRALDKRMTALAAANRLRPKKPRGEKIPRALPLDWVPEQWMGQYLKWRDSYGAKAAREMVSAVSGVPQPTRPEAPKKADKSPPAAAEEAVQKVAPPRLRPLPDRRPEPAQVTTPEPDPAPTEAPEPEAPPAPQKPAMSYFERQLEAARNGAEFIDLRKVYRHNREHDFSITGISDVYG